MPKSNDLTLGLTLSAENVALIFQSTLPVWGATAKFNKFSSLFCHFL